MAKYAVIGLVLLGVAIVGYVGCGGVQDRVGVVADKALKEIDNMIGNLDIQRKKVERKLNDVQEATRKSGETVHPFSKSSTSKRWLSKRS